MTRYLVTGGCGFIGSHLVDALLADGHAVRVLDDLSTGQRSRVPVTAELIIGDVRDSSLLTAAMADIDGCFHLAAVASVMRCNEHWLTSHQVNLSATIAVLEAARQRLPVVYASSAAVYGDNPHLPLRETDKLQPLSSYGVDKATCELHAQVGARVHGVSSIGLRFFNVYGPRQDPQSPYAGVIARFIEGTRRGAVLTVRGDGKQSRDFVFVGDAVAALCAAMRRLECQPTAPFANAYNVCTGQEVSVLELARMIMTLAHRPATWRHARELTGDIRRSCGSPELARQELGFRAAVTLRQGLERTLAAQALAPDHEARDEAAGAGGGMARLSFSLSCDDPCPIPTEGGRPR
jgi:UDP-glucose 4-epimerase